MLKCYYWRQLLTRTNFAQMNGLTNLPFYNMTMATIVSGSSGFEIHFINRTVRNHEQNQISFAIIENHCIFEVLFDNHNSTSYGCKCDCMFPTLLNHALLNCVWLLWHMYGTRLFTGQTYIIAVAVTTTGLKHNWSNAP